MFSEIIAGSMRWGSWGANHSAKDVRKLIEVCLDNGITTFDHADIYGGHTTEELFGNAWKDGYCQGEYPVHIKMRYCNEL